MSRPGNTRRSAFEIVSAYKRPVLRGLRLGSALGAAFALILVATGQLRSLAAVRWAETLCVAAVALALIGTSARRVRRSALGLHHSTRDDVELGSVLLGGAYLVVELFGATVFPLVYLLVAFLVAFLPRSSGIALLGVALLFDGAQNLLPPSSHPIIFFSHAGFLALFAALYHTVLSAQVARGRANEQAAVDRRIREMEERARAYRLVTSGSQTEGDEQDRERWMMASVQEIEGAVGAALEVAEIALKTHTCAAFVLTSDDKSLKLHDCRSLSEQLQREAFPSGEGALGGVIKRRAPIRLCGRLKGVTWYEKDPGVSSLLAVPIVEGQGSGAVRGVLVADRLEATPFTDDDERMLSVVAGEVLRAIEIERVLSYIKRARDEKERLFKALEELNRASKTAEAVGVAIEGARQLERLDFAALTLVEEENGKRRHRVMRVSGVASGRALEGEEFPDNTGLVANVVRYGAPLPGRDVRHMEREVVFDESTSLKGLHSLKILPLRSGERILGTLVAGARRKNAFDDDAVRTLEVLAMQAAQSILRASLFEQTERMATTDGLTGLLNHRTFQSRADEATLLASRYGKKVSLILTDIDHFKSVNDTYGHPTGDQVLKGVSKILRKTARDTDMVARYGGEEFCVLMPETDMAGAKVIAERIRKEVEAATFESELGPLKVTISLGVATFPDVASVKQELIDKADQSLYFAKHHGRNRSVTVLEMEAGSRKAVG
ncbi:MAG TPA: sensor domain-containing diguanylate cyclase [Myxococcales bacterium]|jgi:diguanylate cyclase (GGDEF)-like protein